MAKSRKRHYSTIQVINDIHKMMVTDMTPVRDVLAFIMEKYKVSKTGAYEYLKLFREDYESLTYINREEQLTDAITQLEKHVELLIKEGNKKLALEYKKEIHKLLGLYAAQKVEVNVTKVKAEFLTGEEDKKDE